MTVAGNGKFAIKNPGKRSGTDGTGRVLFIKIRKKVIVAIDSILIINLINTYIRRLPDTLPAPGQPAIMKSFLLPLFLFCFPLCLFSQVQLLEFPSNNQLYPRDLHNDTALVSVRAVLDSAFNDTLLLELNNSAGSNWSVAIPAEQIPGDTFTAVLALKAALWNYSVRFSVKNADSTHLVASAENLVAGDVIIVQGQSNAQSAPYNGDANVWQSNYVRTFGNPDPAQYTDTKWYIADGNGYFSPGAIGQWPMRMASLLQENTQIPIALINGADPGRPIEFFQRNDTFPDDPATNYGRLLIRMRNAGLMGHVRAILYYQGESDGDRADIHKSLFEALYADWSQDFPETEHFTGVQVREGCGAPSLLLREYQKDFEHYLPRFKSMSVNGISGHDGCHYAVNGYGAIGAKMYAQVAEALYARPSAQQLNVRVLGASYVDSTDTRILVETDADSLIAQPGSGTDFRLLGASASVIGIQAQGNKLLLTLDQPVYETQINLSYGGHPGDAGGWVLNGEGNGLFSFFNLPIADHTELPHFDIPGIMSGPGNCLSFDGIDDGVYLGNVLGHSYTKEAWINWNGSGTANNILSGAANTAFWMPIIGTDALLCAGHNGAWLQVFDPAPMQANRWTHVALTYDETLAEMRLYRNGNLVSSAQNVPPHNDPALYIGAYAGFYNFPGKIDEVRVWDTVRTQEEIRSAMCHKLKGDETGLSAYYRFDQWEGTGLKNAVAGKADGQFLNFLNYGWQRSAAPIGTRSAYVYQDTGSLSLALPSGDSLLLSPLAVPDFLHLYFTEEIPNVLQAPAGHTIVDNTRYFGLFYPVESIDSFALTYFYKGNPFTTLDEPRLNLLQRRNNAQPYWEPADQIQLDFTANTLRFTGDQYRECILAIKENTVSALEPAASTALFYPNPGSGRFLSDKDLDAVRVYDVYGRKCMDQQGPVREIDLSARPAGLYRVEWRFEGGFGSGFLLVL